MRAIERHSRREESAESLSEVRDTEITRRHVLTARSHSPDNERGDTFQSACQKNNVVGMR